MILRPAGASDWARVYAWRNDAEAVRNSTSGTAVSLADHMAWFGEQRRLFVGHDPARSAAVGCVRLDDVPGIADAVRMSVMVDARHRGGNYGQQLVQHAIKVARDLGRTLVVADVREHNYASLRAFASCGFYPVRVSEGLARLELAL